MTLKYKFKSFNGWMLLDDIKLSCPIARLYTVLIPDTPFG